MKAPAFQFYPADYLADMKVRMLTWESRGLYIDLLCYCWREGWIPADSSAIGQLCHCHDSAIIDPCLLLFSPHPNDPEKLIHLRLDHEREKQKAFSLERKASGIKGAKRRWLSHSSAIAQPMAQPIAKNGSSSSSSSSSKKKREPSSVEKFQKPSMKDVAEYGRSLAPPFTEAEAFIDFYQSKGWKVGTAPMRDWQATVRNWHRKDQTQATQPRTLKANDCSI